MYSLILYITVLFAGQWRFPLYLTKRGPLLPDPHSHHGFLHSGAEAAGIPAAGLGVPLQSLQRPRRDQFHQISLAGIGRGAGGEAGAGHCCPC